MIEPPRWTLEQLAAEINNAKAIFRYERMEEPLEHYLEAFELHQGRVEELLETTIDLTTLDETALDVLTNPALLESFRYLSGPPISKDDLKVLAEAALTPARLRNDPEMVRRVVDVVRSGLDRRRFPWVTENREPNEGERSAAVLASAALIATSRVATARRSEGKKKQEKQVSDSLIASGFRLVATRNIQTTNQAPLPGEFCGESMLGSRKADFVVGLYDHRIMPIECKVSNSSTNSVKRVNNDAAVKAVAWIREFGTKTIVPTAVLSGVFKPHNLKEAQDKGLTLFWAHDLRSLIDWIGATRKS